MSFLIVLSERSDICTLTGRLSDDVRVEGGQGDDRIVDKHTGTRDVVLDGGDGADWITGGAFTGTILGGAGDDFITLKGLAMVHGGTGRDTVQLNTELYDILGDDGVICLGSDRPDGLLAEAGLAPSPVQVVTLGTSGDVERVQTSIFGEGSSRGGLDILGDEAANHLRGGAAANVLHGGDGGDTVYGFGGNDRLYGGKGHDQLNGAAGHDFLSGGSGDDTLFLDDGDTAGGGAGQDRFSARQGSFTITDFVQGEDEIRLTGASSVSATDSSHLVYVSAGVSYRIELGGTVDALGLSIGRGTTGDVVF